LDDSAVGGGGSGTGIDTTPPSVTSPSANPPGIPNDGTTTSFLSVNVTDDSAIDIVSIDLSPIGGPEKYMLMYYGDALFGCNITAACIPDTYNLTVNATDIYGNYNNSVNITVTVLPYLYGAPNITSWYPAATEIYDIEGATRTFNVSINQTVNVSWLINGTEVSNETGVTESTYTNDSAAVGYWNVSAIVENENGTDMQTWIWEVTPIEVTTISIGDATASPGETTSVLLMIYNAANAGVVDVTLTYDSSVIVMTNIAGVDFDTTIPNLEHNDTGLVRIGAFQMENPGLNGTVTIANITLEAVGSYGHSSPLNISVKEFKDANPEGNKLLCKVSNGTFYWNGDANGDGDVTLFDSMYLAQSELGIPGYEAIEIASDVNGDGKVTLADAMYLAKHVLGISGYEKLK